MIRLALIRHGHTAWNRAGQIQGRTDIPLDDMAKSQLGALRLPPPWDAADLWASPLMRARQTAELIAGRTARVDDALIEMDWGDWEGRKGAELRADPASGFRDIETWGWDYRPPGGESPADVLARLLPWVSSLRRDSVAVCHIGIMRMLMARATGWNFDGEAPFAVKRNRLFVLNIRDEDWSLDPNPVRLTERRS